MKETVRVDLAVRMTSKAFFSLMPADCSSRAAAVLRDSTVWKPSSCSFCAVAGPMPGRSSRYSYFFFCWGSSVILVPRLRV
jgi:hypothetical protein